MNKKILFTLSLLSILVFLSGCGGGGGGGSISAPPWADPGVPAVVRLTASQYVAQLGSTINLRAKVLDGNGKILQGVTVNFSNISSPLIGTLSAASAITDKYGVAKVTITSPTAGLATVVASVSSLSDKKTFQFSSSVSLSATMSMAVNSVPGNGTYDEPSDYTLFENSADDTVTILATVLNGDGTPAIGKSITWGADNSQVKITPSTSTTNAEGKAIVTVKVTSSSILDAETFVTVFASASNGASNMKTFFLKPVTVSSSSSSLSANPTRITPNGSSALTAVVKLNTGAVAPDGTTVNFTTTCGTVTPFAQTSGGLASGTFTGPASEGTCTVTATAAGVTIGTAPILVTSQLVVIPDKVSVAVGETDSVTVFGGIPNYTIISSSPSIATVSPPPLTASGQSFTVTGVAQGSADITVRDSSGTTVKVTATVTTSGGGGAGTTLGIMPGSVTVKGIKNTFTDWDGNPADDVTFVLTGDIVGFANCVSSNTSTITSPGLQSNFVNTFTIDPDEVTATTVVTITCTDEGGFTTMATVTVDPPALTIRLNPIHVIGRANPAGGDADITDDVLVEVVGGVPPYVVNIEPFSLSTIVPGGPWYHSTAAPWTFLVDPTNVLTNTVVTFEVTDNLGATANATLVVYTENTELVASTSKENVIGLANPDGDTADDVIISVAGANNPFIVSWVCGTPNPVAATPASPVVVAGTSGTVTFDPDVNATTSDPKACTVNVTDNLGSAATLNVSVWK